MKRLIVLVVILGGSALEVRGQGQFFFLNAQAPTRLRSADGPLAGPGIWAHMLAGADTNSLVPVGLPAEHYADGIVAGGRVSVPGLDIGQYASVQMVAWDGRLWGTDLAGVPLDQLGRTDIVLVGLSREPFPLTSPRFTQPAVVPVPEPSVLGLLLAGTGAFLAWRENRCRRLRAESLRARWRKPRSRAERRWSSSASSAAA